jgi:hypothetical protein
MQHRHCASAQVKLYSSLGLSLGLLVIVVLSLVSLAGLAGAIPLAYAAGENGVREVITPTNLAATGLTQALSAASGDGHQFANTGREVVIVNNGHSETITLTIVTGGTVGGLDIEDVDVAIDAGDTALVGPFETPIFNQTSGAAAGRVYLNWSAAVTGTVANSVTLNVYRMN